MPPAQTIWIVYASIASTTVLIPVVAFLQTPPVREAPAPYAVAFLVLALGMVGASLALPRINPRLQGTFSGYIIRWALAESAVMFGFAGRMNGLPLWHLGLCAALALVGLLLAMPTAFAGGGRPTPPPV